MAENRVENKLGLLAATVIGINAMIGAGIFAMPALLSSTAGPASIFSYIISSLLILSIVFPLGKLALLYSGEGWGYRYPAVWGGHLIGLISSFGYLTGVIVAMGFLIQQLGLWLHVFIPGNALYLGAIGFFIIALLVLAGTEIASWGQYAIAFCVFAPLIITSIICFFHGNPTLLVPFMPYGVKSVFSALPKVIFSLLGFESISSLYGIVKNPQYTVPRAAIFSVLIVVGLYVLFVSSAFMAIPPLAFTQGVNEAFADVLSKVVVGYGWLKVVTSIGALFAIIGTLHSMVWSIGLLLHNVVGMMKSVFLQQAYKNGAISAFRCIALVSVLSLICALVIPAEQIVPLTPLFIVPAYALSLITLLFRKEEWQSGYNVITLFALSSCAGLIYLAWLDVAQLFFA